MNEGFVNASVITIGDELLIGQVVDTNSAWIAQELNKAGIWMRRRVAVGDDQDEIFNALDEESKHADIILITGGLGPTADDITKPVLCKYFGGKLVINEEVLSYIKHLFENVYRRAFIERNALQAELPDNCTVIHNQRGTAPGMWFEKDNKVFVSMPGVPHEMKAMMTELVIPKLQQRFITKTIVHRTLLTAGIGESFLAEHIKEWELALPGYIRLAYLPNNGMVRLRLTASGNDKAYLDASLTEQFQALVNLVSEWLVVDEDITIQQLIGRMLKQRKQFLATAESCTGGYIAHLLTRESGASDNYKGTVVSYANEVKIDVLGVSRGTLQSVGAVSEDTVKQMVAGALSELKTDYAIATSGIMGPDGGTPNKPVGTVWVAVGNKERTVTKLFHFRFDRLRNIELTATNALNMLRKFILESES
jgi:nicotinamide-nucleotide amidase